MKKLLISCCILFVIGISLITAGKLSGGMLYGVYYEGALHPFHSPLHFISQHHFPYRLGWWWDDTADDIADAIDDALDEAGDALNDALYEIDDALDEVLEAAHETVHDLRFGD